MFDRVPTHILALAPATTAACCDHEIEALHQRCGVYTKPDIVARILDAVGWRSSKNLSKMRLLEPAAGDGAFVVEAARRLVAACVRYRVKLRISFLVDRIRAYELHPGEAQRARTRVIDALRKSGVHRLTAEACARAWILNEDFLLAARPRKMFTHAVGNPPYIRWSKIPARLKKDYEARLPREIIGGDLFMPFLHLGLEYLQPTGECGFLCSDRWRFMAFAEAFRMKWLPRLDIQSEQVVPASDAFVKDVDSYPTILIASKRPEKQKGKRKAFSKKKGKTLKELGYVVKVGPALGHTPAYVLESNQKDVEPLLIRQWVDGSDISEGKITRSGRRVITMYGADGKLIDLNLFSRLKARLKRYEEQLEKRSIVVNGAPWYRPIDRVKAADWARPKLLVPELAKVPRLAIDRSGAIPSHGVYAIFAPNDDVEALYEKLRNGKLAVALKNTAPRVKGGYIRCYKRFLLTIRIPN